MRKSPLSLALAVGLLSFAPRSRAEDKPDASALARLAKTEADIQAKLQDLEQKMEALAVQLEREGYRHEAGLLKSGVAHAREGNLRGRMSDIVQALERGLPGTAGEQAHEVLEGLRTLLAILEDREREFAKRKLEERIAAAREAADRTSALEREEAALEQKIE